MSVAAVSSMAGTPRAIADVVNERARQIEKGFTPAHDDAHECAELVRAAMAHALAASVRTIADLDRATALWPFEPEAFKVEGERESLVVAAAFLIAEIVRRDRVEARKAGR